MSSYKPGEGYDKGFNCRMNGGELPSQALFMSDPFWSEYKTGWEDADIKIINEARERNTCSKPKCCKKKDFIQD